MRATLLRSAGAGATDAAAEAIEAWAVRRLATYDDAERSLCFGRLDLESGDAPLYVGRRWVDDDEGVVVVNWQAPAARPFYTATPAAPHGVTLRRRFRTGGRTITGISDEALDGSLADAVGVDDYLLEELERARDIRMRDIVATIQADSTASSRVNRNHRSSSREDRAPGRPPSASTGRPTSSSPTGPRYGASSSSARIPRSWTTSRTCCRRWARTASSNGQSTSSSMASR